MWKLIKEKFGKKKDEEQEEIVPESKKKEYSKAIGSALLIAMVLKLFAFQAFTIPTGSMLETLQIGDFLFVEKFTLGARTPERIRIPDIAFRGKVVIPGKTLVKNIPTLKMPGFRDPKQGDIIVFAYPNNKNLDYIKRCVAIAGDTVEVVNGVLYVNGDVYESNFGDRDGDHTCIPSWTDPESCPAPRVKKDQAKYVSTPSLKSWPPDGKNRPYTIPEGHIFMMGDNRYNSADSRYWGPLDMKLIKGKAAVIYWSWDPKKGNIRFSRILDIIR